MQGQLYRQRRRIVVTVLVTMLAAAWEWSAGAGAFFMGLVAAATSVVFIMGLPGFRRALECAAFGFLIAALLPGSAWALLALTILFGGIAHYVLYGRWADPMSARLGLQSHRVARTHLPVSEVWKALVPGESHPDDYWSGTLIDFNRDPDDPETMYLRFETETGVVDDMTLSFVERSAPSKCRYYLESEHDGIVEDTAISITLSETAEGRTNIATVMENGALLPRIAFARWFDDVFGDELDRFAATMSARRVWTVKRAPDREPRLRPAAGTGVGA